MQQLVIPHIVGTEADKSSPLPICRQIVTTIILTLSFCCLLSAVCVTMIAYRVFMYLTASCFCLYVRARNFAAAYVYCVHVRVCASHLCSCLYCLCIIVVCSFLSILATISCYLMHNDNIDNIDTLYLPALCRVVTLFFMFTVHFWKVWL